MHFTDDQINRTVEKVIGCGIEVHREFGPGLLESVYKECLGIELTNAGLCFDIERRFPLKYKGTPINCRFQVDFVVEDAVIVELKSIEAVHPIHLARGDIFKAGQLSGWIDHELQRHVAPCRPQTTLASEPLPWETQASRVPAMTAMASDPLGLLTS